MFPSREQPKTSFVSPVAPNYCCDRYRVIKALAQGRLQSHLLAQDESKLPVSRTAWSNNCALGKYTRGFADGAGTVCEAKTLIKISSHPRTTAAGLL